MTAEHWLDKGRSRYKVGDYVADLFLQEIVQQYLAFIIYQVVN